MASFLEQRKKLIIEGCPICHGKNPICSCYSKFSLDFKKYNAHIPQRFFDSSIKNTNHNIEKFIRGELQGLYLEGDSKITKTELLCAILISCLSNGKECYMTDALECSQVITGHWKNLYPEQYRKVLNCDVLGINDVGDERKPDSGVVEEVFDGLIKERLFDGKQVIITSSLDVTQFCAVYTKARYDLIASSFKVISFPKVDLKNIFKDIRV